MTIETCDDLTAAVGSQLARWAELIGGKPWGAKEGKPRIYMPFRKGVTAYFAFEDFPTGDEAELLGGDKLCVYIADCGQHPNWYRAQRAQIMRRLRPASLALSALHVGDESLAKDIVASDMNIDDKMLDDADHALIDGRLDDARKILTL